MAEPWTKDWAIERMQTNARLQEVLALEPRLRPILDAACAQQDGRGYNRVRRYYELKAQAVRLVGFGAARRELRNSRDFDLVIGTIDELLPADAADRHESEALTEDAEEAAIDEPKPYYRLYNAPSLEYWHWKKE